MLGFDLAQVWGPVSSLMPGLQEHEADRWEGEANGKRGRPRASGNPTRTRRPRVVPWPPKLVAGAARTVLDPSPPSRTHTHQEARSWGPKEHPVSFLNPVTGIPGQGVNYYCHVSC